MTNDQRQDFAAAFYRQAQSDWRVYKLLSATSGVPRCHALQHLQAACEKLGKAYRLRDTAGRLDVIASKHTGFTHFVNAFLRSSTLLVEYRGQLARHQALSRLCVTLSREIEKLAPAIDRATSPENAEYPWLRDGTVVAPCEYKYPALSLLSEPGGRAFLRVVERAFRDYDQITIH